MGDRELLEKAAKAARLSVVGLADKMLVDPGHRTGGLIVVTLKGGHTAWNPLADNGDALWLAVNQSICVEFGYCSDDAPVVRCGPEWERETWPEAPNFPDPYAATRRAIVRAAASLSPGQQEDPGK